MRNISRITQLTFCFSVIFSWFFSTTLASPIEKIVVGEKFFVACEKVPVRKSPSAWAEIIGHIKFGSRIVPKKLFNRFQLLDSDENSRGMLEIGKTREELEEITEDDYTRVIWVGIDMGAIPASCLIEDKDLLSLDEMKKRVKKIATAKAKKGFSEDERGAQTAMRGAAGSAKFGKPNFEMADKLILYAIESKAKSEDKNLLFRKVGKLGEYK